MNPWYTVLVPGFAFALDNIILLITDRSKDPVTLTAKQRLITNLVRIISGLVVVSIAWLVIAQKWMNSDLKVTLASIPEGLAYAFAVAGFFRLLSSLISAIVFRVLADKTSLRQEGNKVWLGAYMFILGTFAVVWIDRNVSPIFVPTLVLVGTLIVIVAMHLISIYATKLSMPTKS